MLMMILMYLTQYTAIISTTNLVIAKIQFKEKSLMFHEGIPNVVAP